MKPENMQTYETCLPDIESILPGLAEVIDADYNQGEFSTAEEIFQSNNKEIDQWFLNGRSGVNFAVTFEQHEGYLFVKLRGQGDPYERAKHYLYDCYLKQGGNTDAQEAP